MKWVREKACIDRKNILQHLVFAYIKSKPKTFMSQLNKCRDDINFQRD